ncbi:hypothetical protein OQ889_23780, partial [Mycobacterium ulcerans]|nr:hypothetical protein [Mycobacterium ulcerans]
MPEVPPKDPGPAGVRAQTATAVSMGRRASRVDSGPPRAPALLISRLVSWVDDLWCRAIGAAV